MQQAHLEATMLRAIATSACMQLGAHLARQLRFQGIRSFGEIVNINWDALMISGLHKLLSSASGAPTLHHMLTPCGTA